VRHGGEGVIGGTTLVWLLILKVRDGMRGLCTV
jgi:hypothetical protein